MIDMSALEAQVEHEMQRHKVPAFGLAIVEGSEVTYARGFGVTSVEHPCLSVTPQTLFCCGSISKSLTAATIMCLVDRGKLALDAPVTTYLPWLTFSHPAFASGVTLRRLLSHSSGLFGTAGNFGPRDLSGLETFIRDTIPHLDFVAPPGRVYEYCSFGVDLAGYVAEVAGGQYFPDLVREYLLDPLDMQRTTYDRTVAMTFDVALPHITAGDGGFTVQHRMFDYAAANPAAQAMTSTLDLAHFVIMALNGGLFRGRRVLPARLVAEMLRPQVGLHDADGSGYGLGFFTLQCRGRRWITHGGMLTPYLCEISLLPDEGIGVIFQCNVTNDFDPAAIRRRIFDEYLGSSTSAAQPVAAFRPRPTVTLSDYAGAYFSLAAGLVTISHVADHLVVERQGEYIDLRPARDNLFMSQDSSVVVGFVLETTQAPQYFMLDEHVYSRFEPQAAVELASSTMEAYRGHYRFDDGDSAAVWIQHGTLYLSLSWLDGHHQCIPLSERKFASAVGLVEFRLHPQGHYVLVWAGGVLTERLIEEPQ